MSTNKNNTVGRDAETREKTGAEPRHNARLAEWTNPVGEPTAGADTQKASGTGRYITVLLTACHRGMMTICS